LLDMACGPGRLTFALAPFFGEVWAVDVEPEMIAAARSESARHGLRHIRWITHRAETLAAPPASFDLVSFGEAFHRVNQPVVVDLVHRWLRPGGAVAIVGCSYGILSGEGIWQAAVAGVVRRWSQRQAPTPDAGDPKPTGMGPEHNEQVLGAAGFLEVASHPFVQRVDWTIESITGFLASTSNCSERALRGSAGAVAAEVGAALGDDARDRFPEALQCGYTFGRKPAAP
jgi:SAM-dependent methyltransferase